ncbi:MAG: tetratricopeptide repeat protein [Candidatus Moduliflexus flocculans]|nr:tetratricopeptide repeat protein [Candidatus Moduliflexus flocculans]
MPPRRRAPGRTRKGRLRSSIGGTGSSAREKTDEALAAFEEFAAKYPEVYGVRLNIGTACLKKGDLDRAEAEFRGVLDEASRDQGDPRKELETSLRALSGLGEVALRKGDLEAAQTGLPPGPGDLAERSPPPPTTSARSSSRTSAIDEAVAFFEMAAKIKPEWPKPYHRLGLAFLNKGDFDKALANLRKFVELDPRRTRRPGASGRRSPRSRR